MESDGPPAFAATTGTRSQPPSTRNERHA